MEDVHVLSLVLYMKHDNKKTKKSWLFTSLRQTALLTPTVVFPVVLSAVRHITAILEV